MSDQEITKPDPPTPALAETPPTETTTPAETTKQAPQASPAPPTSPSYTKPLFVTDPRFKTIEKQFVLETQKKFGKLFGRCTDKAQRNFPFEFLGWIAGFAFHQIRSIELGFKHMGWSNPEVAFLDIFNALVKNYREGEPKPETVKLGEAFPEPGGGVTDTAPPSTPGAAGEIKEK